MAKLYLGGHIDDDSRERTGDRLSLDASDLTTHGVIVGMTGSGKTGLGVIVLEEALREGIPCLIIDPKGDMTNLLLTFPELRAEDFEPWIDESDATRQGKELGQAALETSQRWRDGLDSWDLGGADIAALRDACEMTIYTPGSSAGVPINLLGSLAGPEGGADAGGEEMREEIGAIVAGILGLVGIKADLMADREAILMATIIEKAWTAAAEGTEFTIEDLIRQVQDPPFRTLGVFDVDDFFPPKDRLALAMRLNNLIASPAFEGWRQGVALDPHRLLWSQPTGKPRAAILYLAHLSDDERQFVVSTVLSKLITWMRRQSGTSNLRALVYMDETFGFLPPVANPPAKQPILTLFKQARAFGIGMLLATQNPVDLDYKSMGNAGTWAIGRLQTERDKARILEALRSASGEADIAQLDTTISGLAQRQFLLYRARSNTPDLFTTRWAMSFLRGPLTRDEVAILMEDERPAPLPAQESAAPDGDEGATTETTDRPASRSAPPVGQSHLSPSAPWAPDLGIKPHGTHFAPAIAARVHLRYNDTAARTQHNEEWEAVYFPLSDPFNPAAGVRVDHDDRDFEGTAPEGATYEDPAIDLSSRALTQIRGTITDHLVATETLTVFRNSDLKLYSRAGESRPEFAERCLEEARRQAADEAAKTVRRLESRLTTTRRKVRDATQRVAQAEGDAELRRRDEHLSTAESVIGMITGGRRASTAGARNRRTATMRAEQRVVDARERLALAERELAELQAESDAAEATELATRVPLADRIDEVELSPGSTTTRVEMVEVVWVPVG